MMIPIFSLFFLFLTTGEAQLEPGFYGSTCPKAESMVREVLLKAMINETRSICVISLLQNMLCGTELLTKYGLLKNIRMSKESEVQTDVVRTVLPSIIPPSYRGTTIRYLYYVRSIFSGQWLILENGHTESDLAQKLDWLVLIDFLIFLALLYLENSKSAIRIASTAEQLEVKDESILLFSKSSGLKINAPV